MDELALDLTKVTERFIKDSTKEFYLNYTSLSKKEKEAIRMYKDFLLGELGVVQTVIKHAR